MNTVETSWVFAICLSVIYFIIALSFSMYKDAYTYVADTTVKERDTVEMFRLIEAGEEVLH